MRAPLESLPTVARRLKAGKMLLGGVPAKQVVVELHLSPQTVRRYQALISDGGLDALMSLKVGGRVSALDSQAREWLANALRGPATAHGFASARWSNARLRALIEKTYGVRFSRVHTWEICQELGLGHKLL